MTLTSQSGAAGEDKNSLFAPDSGTIPTEYESALLSFTSTGDNKPKDQPPVSGVFAVTPETLVSSASEQNQPTTIKDKKTARQTAYRLFREQLRRYLRVVEVRQEELAWAIGLEPKVLSRKLNLTQAAFVTLSEARRLSIKLVELGALNYQWQALELLQTLYPDQDFAREEWRTAPLNRLDLPRFRGGIGQVAEPVGSGLGTGQTAQPGEVVAVEAPHNQPGEVLPEAATVEEVEEVIQPGEKRPKSQLGSGSSARRGIKFVGPGLDEGGSEQHGSAGGGVGAAGWDEGNEDGTPGLLPLTTGVPLIGRDKELEQARQWLVDKDNPIKVLTIAGPGGVGKTSLAAALARSLVGSSEYPDGAIWVSLTTLPAGATTQELSEAIARAMGLTFQPGVDTVSQIKNYLAGKRLVVVLDNYEQVEELRNNLLLVRLLSALPGLQIVVTSRKVVKIPASTQTLKLASLIYPRIGENLPPVTELAENYSSIELFIRQVRLVEPGFALSEGNAGAVVGLCQKLDGVPLAIAIAAARVSQFGVVGVLGQINRHGALPMLEDAGQGEERHQSQRATIGWSYDLLSDEERRIWRGLAVFAGSVGIEAIERVLGEGLSAVEVDTRIVAGLVDKSMLFKVEDSMVGLVGPGAGSAGESRYYLHGVMREYALDRVREQAGEEDKVREDHARYYLGLAEEAGPKLNGPERAGWSVRLGVEYENIKVALGWLVEHGAGRAGGDSSNSMVEEAYRLTGAMGQYWFNNRLVAEGQSWLERVLGLARARAGEVSNLPLLLCVSL